LRKRTVDILPLARHFVACASAQAGRSPLEIAARAERALERHAWPGNVRELRNVMERAVSVARGASTLEIEHLDLPEGAPPEDVSHGIEPVRSTKATLPAPTTLLDAVHSFEREQLLEALRATAGNQTEAAKILGVSRRTLINKIIQHGISRPRMKTQR
jgi:DNA-binding NtrC family response regulator